MGPLLTFLRAIDAQHCRCRACQVAFAAIGVTEVSRTEPQAVAVLQGSNSPQLEAEGLFRAALVVLLFQHAIQLPSGEYAVDPMDIRADLEASFNGALRVMNLPASVVSVVSRSITH